MTFPVVTLDEEMSLREATTIMARRKVSGAPVLNGDGKLVGILSERDVLEKAMEQVGPDMECQTISFLALPYERIVRDEEVCRRYRTVGDAQVSGVMNAEVIAVDADEMVEKALETMLRFDVNRLPVIDGEGKLVGIISRQDILWSMCRGLRRECPEGTSAK